MPMIKWSCESIVSSSACRLAPAVSPVVSEKVADSRVFAYAPRAKGALERSVDVSAGYSGPHRFEGGGQEAVKRCLVQVP